MTRAYYNEFDPFAAKWLENLIHAGYIAKGDVDARSIADVEPGDLRGYAQCHFFAGIGGWSHAFRLAGVPDSAPYWTGSCPCQPFSQAGKRKGEADERHLWPVFGRLIGECRPATVFGEQVASRDGRDWLSGVRVDLEGMAYAVGAVDMCAAGVGAPHIRQRLYWVADATTSREGRQGVRGPCESGGAYGVGSPSELSGRRESRSGLADAYGCTSEQRRSLGRGGVTGSATETRAGLASDDSASGLGNADVTRSQRREVLPECRDERAIRPSSVDWSDCEWIECADGWRRVKSGVRLLANGVPGRVGKLRGYGNAIVPQVAAKFVSAWLECQP